MSIIFCKKEKKKKKPELSKTINFGVKPKMANRNCVEKNWKICWKKKEKIVKL